MSSKQPDNSSLPQMSPQRLCDAAEASLVAAVEVAEKTRGPWPYPADLMGRPNQPRCLAPFQTWEIQEACRFLVRMGVLDRPRFRPAA